MDRVLLDTSAVIAFLEGEEGGPRVRDLLAGAEVLISFPTLIEVHYIATREESEVAARQQQATLKRLPVTFLWEMDEPTVLAAARFKARHRLSFADAIIAAFAMRQHAILVHKDPGFLALGDLVPQEVLPLKA